MLVPVFTVAENVVLGHEPTGPGGLLDLGAARTLVREISARFGFDLDPDARVENLPVGAQQRRSEKHTSELQSRGHLVCRLLLEKKKKKYTGMTTTAAASAAARTLP